MADPYDLLTLDEGKAAINVQGLEAKYDLAVDAYITAASERIVDMCGPVVDRTFTGEVYDGGAGWIALRNAAFGPLAITTIDALSEYDYTGTATALSVEDFDTKPVYGFMVDAALGVIRRRSSGSGYVFVAGSQNVVVTYTSGRAASTATVPSKFKVAAQILVAHLWRQRGPQAGAYRTDTDSGPMFGVAPFAMPRAVEDMLAYDRRPPVIA